MINKINIFLQSTFLRDLPLSITDKGNMVYVKYKEVLIATYNLSELESQHKLREGCHISTSLEQYILTTIIRDLTKEDLENRTSIKD